MRTVPPWCLDVDRMLCVHMPIKPFLVGTSVKTSWIMARENFSVDHLVFSAKE
jgi:hypothetical protein